MGFAIKQYVCLNPNKGDPSNKPISGFQILLASLISMVLLQLVSVTLI